MHLFENIHTQCMDSKNIDVDAELCFINVLVLQLRSETDPWNTKGCQ
jgi:hypothetical protein